MNKDRMSWADVLDRIFTQRLDEDEIEIAVHNGWKFGATCASLQIPYSALLDAGLPF